MLNTLIFTVDNYILKKKKQCIPRHATIAIVYFLVELNFIISYCKMLNILFTGPHSTVGNVSGYRCVSDCRSRGREFDPGPVPYFRGD